MAVPTHHGILDPRVPLLQQNCSGKHVRRQGANKLSTYWTVCPGRWQGNGDPTGAIFLTKNASAGVGATLFGVCEHGAFIGSQTSGEDNEKRWPLYTVAEMPLMKAKM